jgi:putative ABC transport system permease protein
MKVLFYLTYALRALKRGGQRTALAMLCIAFGVMSLVAMQLVADNFTAVVMTDPRAEIGGDIALHGPQHVVSASQIDEVAALQAKGVISRYTPLADAGGQMMSLANGGMYLVDHVIGVDPTTYPLVGTMHINEPQGKSLADLLQSMSDAVVTRDVADRLGMKVGDRFALSARAGSVPAQFVLRGIVGATPNHRGDGVYLNLQTARQVSAWPDVVTQVSVIWQNSSSGEVAQAQLDAWRAAGWSITTPEDVLNDSSRSQVTDVFGFMFKGAGILGLIVGGIGVATTLRVLLARRTLEIAMLKTMGYRKRDLTILFGVETLILGSVGGLFGALAAMVISRQLIVLLARTGVMLFDYSVNTTVIVGGIFIGIVTSVVFGLHPIISSSGISPITLLRQLPADRGQRRWRRRLGSAALFGVLGVLFTTVCGLIMNSLLEGAGIVVGGLICLLILGTLLGTVLTLIASIPWPGSGMMTLARTNLKRQRMTLIFPLLALFAGVFAIGFATVTVYSANYRVIGHQLPDTGDNLLVYARMQDQARAEQQAAQAGVDAVHVAYQVPIWVQDAAGKTVSAIDTLVGRMDDDVKSSFALSGEPWPGDAQTVYVPSQQVEALPIGQPITVTTPAGLVRRMRVGGYYTLTRESALALDAGGLLVPQRVAAELGGVATSLSMTGQANEDQLTAATRAMRAALPQAIVVNIDDLNEIFNRTLNNLFVFVIAVAGLALAAGAVLIANAVGLSMLQRQREMGILKAVGFSSRDVLRMVALENGLLGLLSGVAGIGGVAIAVVVVNQLHPASKLVMSVPQVAGLVVVSVLIASGVSIATAWRPTRVHPMEVLRAE